MSNVYGILGVRKKHKFIKYEQANKKMSKVLIVFQTTKIRTRTIKIQNTATHVDTHGVATDVGNSKHLGIPADTCVDCQIWSFLCPFGVGKDPFFF